MGIMISFCITVYNQSELVKKCVDSIVKYDGQDIEIVISDDRSTEDIKAIVDRYQDDRIKYFYNETNLGHDRNIVSVLSKATGKYAFLLRTRDFVIPSAIPLLIKYAEEGKASYVTGEAINQDGDLKIQYTRECFPCGGEAIEANYKLFIHPSGSMYRTEDLNFEELMGFLNENAVPKNGFIVHNMIRLKLAITGDFHIIKKPVWIYTDTESAGDRAVNKSTDGVSVYDPSLTVKRYEYEVKWARQILEGENYKNAFFLLTALYIDLITWGFKLSNSDKQTQYHYNYKEVEFSVSKQRKQFRKVCDELYDVKLGETQAIYKRRIDCLFLKNKTYDAVKYIVRKVTYGSSVYNMAARIYKKYVKGL